MKTAKELKEQYESELKKLQEKCHHTNQSNWMEHCWAIGHFSGFEVKQCNDCWKSLQYRYRCIACGNEFITTEKRNLYQADCLCDECLKKGKYYCCTHEQFHNNARGCPLCLEIYEDEET